MRVTERSAEHGRACRLLADLKTLNEVQIPLWIYFFQIVQQPTPTTHHHQEPAPTGVVPFVGAQMLGQCVDARRQNGNLDFGRAGIDRRATILPNQFCLPLSGNSHLLPQLAPPRLARMLRLPKRFPPTACVNPLTYLIPVTNTKSVSLADIDSNATGARQGPEGEKTGLKVVKMGYLPAVCDEFAASSRLSKKMAVAVSCRMTVTNGEMPLLQALEPLC
jgi:hypothetical protein